ncbi:TniB family NTP-binding protein [Ancylobacter sp. VNQ12]|jgi:type II secretory pathway predicted ATPase ExeA|uniref:TniB family NTP-binding protein n=2 Tax=Hyphomicrobiales TaxID=356 RepID=UPI003C0710F1
MMTEAFSHLFPASRPIAALSADERIRRIRADRWINYPRAEQALQKLEALLAFPPRARMPNLLIVGASGMGKTMIVEKFARDHPSQFDTVTGRMHMPVIAVQMVPGPDEARFYKRLLAAIGAPEPPRATLSVLESLTLRLLSEIRPGLLVIDEVHSLQAGTVREQTRFLNMLRFLGNELRIPLVCVGTQQARNALRTDDQLVRRFEAFALPPWQNDEDFGGLIGSLQRSLPLRQPSEFADATLKRLIEVTGGITAGIFSLVSALAIAAIESGEERITPGAVADKRSVLALVGEPV